MGRQILIKFDHLECFNILTTKTIMASITFPNASEDVKVHGDLIEFLDTQRCEICQTNNRKCIINRGDRSCLICGGLNLSCIFERRMRLRGSVNDFKWDTLLAKESLFRAMGGSPSIWNE